MHKLNSLSRILIFGASLLLIVSFFVPVWSIFLFAPQYPEGLTMNIWLNAISGDVDVINGLNHYIGMKHINVDMFPEFAFLRYVVLFYLILGLIVAIKGDDRWLFWYLVFTAFGGAFAMFDFYRWGYEYGHNLDPNAAIKVPGLSYQPPVIGHKRLLNFDAYSYPAVGGWIVIGAAGLMILIWIGSRLKFTQRYFVQMAFIPLLLLVSITACNTEPEPIQSGKDNCTFCKMGITDLRYSTEIITDKGKIFKFDDAGCMIRWISSSGMNQSQIKKILVSHYDNPKEWIDAKKAIFIQSASIHSPMNFNFAALTPDQKPQDIFAMQEIIKLNWNEIQAKIQR